MTDNFPIILGAKSLLGHKRWVLYGDQIVLEGRDILYGWSRENAIPFANILVVYRFKRPVYGYLTWLLLGLPLLLIGALTFSSSQPVAAFFGILGALISLTSAIAGFRHRPHIMLHTSVLRHSIRLDRPLFRAGLRRTFFSTLSRLLDIPDLSREEPYPFIQTTVAASPNAPAAPPAPTLPSEAPPVSPLSTPEPPAPQNPPSRPE